MIQKAATMGNWWLAASSQQCACLCIMPRAKFFGKPSNHPGDSISLQPRFGTLQLLAFPKTKITLGNKFQTISEIRETMTGQLMETGRTVWGPKVPTLKGTEASLPCVQCFLYLVSSVNGSIFHSTWLDAFCTDLVYTTFSFSNFVFTSWLL